MPRAGGGPGRPTHGLSGATYWAAPCSYGPTAPPRGGGLNGVSRVPHRSVAAAVLAGLYAVSANALLGGDSVRNTLSAQLSVYFVCISARFKWLLAAHTASSISFAGVELTDETAVVDPERRTPNSR